MRKEAQTLTPNTAIYDAPDADHTWNVKVLKILSYLTAHFLI